MQKIEKYIWKKLIYILWSFSLKVVYNFRLQDPLPQIKMKAI